MLQVILHQHTLHLSRIARLPIVIHTKPTADLLDAPGHERYQRLHRPIPTIFG